MLMNRRMNSALSILAAGLFFFAAMPASADDKPYEPVSGQAGKDVVWVPTPPELVEKMLDLAKVTPNDFVMDLGSGDGRNIIAAAKRGARAVGVEYNPDMVQLSRAEAARAGVAGKATFVQGDMYQADISQATVLALFLLPENLDRLLPRMLDMRPGSRIVLNTFAIPAWDADLIERLEQGCGAWCEALLYIVPAKVAGEWRFDEGTLRLQQQFQKVSGDYEAGGTRVPLADVRLQGDRIEFSVRGVRYSGIVHGDAMMGERQDPIRSHWRASRNGD
jgi:precorrin-6B methylase 2